jgi:hypothetical protein
LDRTIWGGKFEAIVESEKCDTLTVNELFSKRGAAEERDRRKEIAVTDRNRGENKERCRRENDRWTSQLVVGMEYDI